jgi:hypothetical protein
MRDQIDHSLRWTMPGPDSSYSCFEHQRFWKVLREARMEPPIQTEYFLSGGATILTCTQVRGQEPKYKRISSDLHAGRGKAGQLLLHTICDTRVHSSTTRKDDVSVEITTDIEITLEDRVVAYFTKLIIHGIEHSETQLTWSHEYQQLPSRA